jgi:hypothetical protein
MAVICFAILVHTNRDCVRDLVENLRTFAPGSRLVLFNGGSDPGLAHGLGVPVCPASGPTRWGWGNLRLLDTLEWVVQTGVDFDYLVNVEGDMLLVKPGFDAWLPRALAGYGYMAVQLRRLDRAADWVVAQRFLPKWPRVWQPLFGIDAPYGCFMPGQVFSADCVRRMTAHPRLSAIRDAVVRSSVPSLEEVLYPTLAASTGVRMRPAPSAHEQALRYRTPHREAELRSYVADPDVFLIHPVGMHLDSPDRRFLTGRDGSVQGAEADERWAGWPPPAAPRPRYRDALTRLRSAWIALKPE